MDSHYPSDRTNLYRFRAHIAIGILAEDKWPGNDESINVPFYHGTIERQVQGSISGRGRAQTEQLAKRNYHRSHETTVDQEQHVPRLSRVPQNLQWDSLQRTFWCELDLERLFEFCGIQSCKGVGKNNNHVLSKPNDSSIPYNWKQTTKSHARHKLNNVFQ